VICVFSYLFVVMASSFDLLVVFVSIYHSILYACHIQLMPHHKSKDNMIENLLEYRNCSNHSIASIHHR